MVERIPWDQYFLAQSLILSLRSTCQRLMVGAVIVRDKRIIAGGYNGSVSGDDHCVDAGCYLEDGHCMRTIHAEMNALLQCAKFGASTDGAELYVTHRPCLQCTKSLIQAGIKRIKYLYDYHNHPYADKLIAQQHISIEKGELPENIFELFGQLHADNLQNETRDGHTVEEI
ncbi:MAG: ComE operon protein 2 [Aerococcus sp.]|nr:ComE operon protein 2 [Aerococcus sp.]